MQTLGMVRGSREITPPSACLQRRKIDALLFACVWMLLGYGILVSPSPGTH